MLTPPPHFGAGLLEAREQALGRRSRASTSVWCYGCPSRPAQPAGAARSLAAGAHLRAPRGGRSRRVHESRAAAAVLGRRCRSLAALVWRRFGSCHCNRHAATAALDAAQKSGGGDARWWALQRRYGPRGRCGAGAAVPRVGYGSDRRGAGRAAPRLPCDVGLEG